MLYSSTELISYLMNFTILTLLLIKSELNNDTIVFCKAALLLKFNLFHNCYFPVCYYEAALKQPVLYKED